MSGFVSITCCWKECRIEFGVTTTLHRRCKDDSDQWFYCPNGHRQHFAESEADRTRRERDRLKQENARLAQWEADASERARTAERQARAFKGVATRMKNRVAAGVCPCCNRTFQDLQRHMASKHKSFRDAEITPEEATIQ